MIYEKNAFDMYKEAEELDKKWKRQWEFCLRYFGIPFGICIAGGLFTQNMIFGYGILIFGAIMGGCSLYFSFPQSKAIQKRNLAVKLYGSDEEEY